MKIIRDGNFVRWFRVCIFFCGIVLGYVGLEFEEFPQWVRLILVLIGIVFAAVGGYSSQAHMLRLKPFDNTYGKARGSYDKEKDEP